MIKFYFNFLTISQSDATFYLASNDSFLWAFFHEWKSRRRD